MRLKLSFCQIARSFLLVQLGPEWRLAGESRQRRLCQPLVYVSKCACVSVRVHGCRPVALSQPVIEPSTFVPAYATHSLFPFSFASRPSPSSTLYRRFSMIDILLQNRSPRLTITIIWSHDNDDWSPVVMPVFIIVLYCDTAATFDVSFGRWIMVWLFF